MRELSVYYCQKCGRYAYFQLPRNAVCPVCDTSMKRLQIPYQDFMDLDLEQRDRLISKAIIDASPSYVQRITMSEKMFNQRETIGMLISQVNELQAENKELTNTVAWMHATIWDQLTRMKAMEWELKRLKGDT